MKPEQMSKEELVERVEDSFRADCYRSERDPYRAEILSRMVPPERLARLLDAAKVVIRDNPKVHENFRELARAVEAFDNLRAACAMKGEKDVAANKSNT